jgi:ParB family chromosome partitioning protein
MGELSAGHARALLSSPDRALQDELAKRCVAEGWNVRQIEDLVRTMNAAPDAAPKASSATAGRTRPAALLEVEQRLGNHLDTRVSVAMGKSRGRMTIEFADLDDLERIFRVVVGDQTLDAE